MSGPLALLNKNIKEETVTSGLYTEQYIANKLSSRNDCAPIKT